MFAVFIDLSEAVLVAKHIDLVFAVAPEMGKVSGPKSLGQHDVLIHRGQAGFVVLRQNAPVVAQHVIDFGIYTVALLFFSMPVVISRFALGIAKLLSQTTMQGLATFQTMFHNGSLSVGINV